MNCRHPFAKNQVYYSCYCCNGTAVLYVFTLCNCTDVQHIYHDLCAELQFVTASKCQCRHQEYEPSKAADDTTKKTTNEENQKIYPADISASANLAEICVTLFKNSDEMTALYDGCTVNVDVTEGTFFITITVDGTDAQKCANVANQLAEKAAEVYNSKFSYGQIGTLRQAKVPSAPYAPSNTKNMLIGAAIGLIASCLISILIELIDTTIKSEDDIQDIYGIPIFAEIPDFENQG